MTKTKNNKNQVIVVPTTSKHTKNKNSKKTASKAVISKNSPVLYFQCMSDCCQKGLKGQKITQVAKQCKTKAPALIINRTKQLKELKKALSVVGKFTNSLEKALVNH